MHFPCNWVQSPKTILSPLYTLYANNTPHNPRIALNLLFLLKEHLPQLIRRDPTISILILLAGKLHDRTRRRNLQHPRHITLPQSPHPLLLPNHPHQPHRRRNLLPTIPHRHINLSSRLTHIKRLRHKGRKRPTQPPRHKRLLKKTHLPAPTERLVLFKFMAKIFVAGPVNATEGDVSP